MLLGWCHLHLSHDQQLRVRDRHPSAAPWLHVTTCEKHDRVCTRQYRLWSIDKTNHAALIFKTGELNSVPTWTTAPKAAHRQMLGPLNIAALIRWDREAEPEGECSISLQNKYLTVLGSLGCYQVGPFGPSLAAAVSLGSPSGDRRTAESLDQTLVPVDWCRRFSALTCPAQLLEATS